MKTDYLIIGGGVAGLSAANQLAQSGANVTLLEAGDYPAQKICGEFLSPEAIPILENWDIAPAASVATMNLVMPKAEWKMTFPQSAATTNRFSLDHALALRAQQKGACIQTNAQVTDIKVPQSTNQLYSVTLASGEQWSATTLLISTGRIMNSLMNHPPPTFHYVGAKMHFEGVDISNELIMHLLPNAYFGMAPIGNNQMNVAGLIRCTNEEAMNPIQFLNNFLQKNEVQPFADQLSAATPLFDAWMTTPVPEFGIRPQPNWPNAYFLGDAAGVIPPATGNGLAMGLSSGILAAQYAMQKEPLQYRARWRKEYKGRITRGKWLHKLFLSTQLSRTIPLIATLFPAIPKYCFRSTRAYL